MSKEEGHYIKKNNTYQDNKYKQTDDHEKGTKTDLSQCVEINVFISPI